MTKQPTWLDWLVMLILAAIWGVSFLFIKRSVQVFNPVQMAMWRMVLATAVYLPIAAAYWSKINWKNWKPLLVVAFCGSAIPNFLFAIAGQHIPSGLAGVLNSLTPLFTLISGMMFFQLQANWIKITGVLLGLGGALMLVLSDHPDTGGGGHAFYAMLCVLATVCYAINSNVISKYLRDQPPAAIASAAFILTGGLFLIGLWWSDGWHAAMTHPQGLEALGYIGYLAAFGTVVGSIIYFWLLQRTGALFATSVTYLLPIVALAVGLLDNETVTIQEMLGTGIILTGLWLTKKMNHFYAFLLVFAGGGTGSMVRYAISLLVGPIQNRFPWATMASNVLACLVLGWALGTFWAGGMSDQRKLLIATGFCGGFSTFSTFTAETHLLWQSGPARSRMGNILFNMIICWAAFWIGLKLV